jgi:hypothetical protein
MATDETVVLPPELTIAVTAENMPECVNTLFGITTHLIAVPAVGGIVSLSLTELDRYSPGMYLYGVFLVQSLGAESIMNVTNVDATAGVTIPIGTVFVSCAKPETASATASSAINDTLSQTFSAPGAGGSSDLYVAIGGWLRDNMWVFVNTLGWYKITSIDAGNSKHCVVTHMNPDISYASISATSGTASAGQPVISIAPMMFRPDNDTLVAANAANQPGESILSVGLDFVRSPGVTQPTIEVGTVAATPTNNTDTLFGAVTFSDTTFSVVPTVMLSAVTEVDLAAKEIYFYARDVTVLGFNIYYTQTAAGNAVEFNVNWLAIGA